MLFLGWDDHNHCFGPWQFGTTAILLQLAGLIQMDGSNIDWCFLQSIFIYIYIHLFICIHTIYLYFNIYIWTYQIVFLAVKSNYYPYHSTCQMLKFSSILSPRRGFPGVGVIASCKTQCEYPCCITTTTTSTTFTSITTTVSWRLDWIMSFFPEEMPWQVTRYLKDFKDLLNWFCRWVKHFLCPRCLFWFFLSVLSTFYHEISLE